MARTEPVAPVQTTEPVPAQPVAAQPVATKPVDEQKVGKQGTASNFIWYIFGLIAALLAFRFFFKLFGANSSSGFVDFIYDVSSVLTAPFDNIFNVATTRAGDTRSVFEPSILVALAVYALTAWGIVKLLNLNRKQV